MPTKTLPSKPSLEHLKSQAKDLISALNLSELDAFQRIREFHPRFHALTDNEIKAKSFALSDAYLTIAREYGFASWPKLKAFVERDNRPSPDMPFMDRIEDPVFRDAVALLDAGEEAKLQSFLRANDGVVRQRLSFEGVNYFRNPTLLEFCAENPIRNGRLPENIVAVVQVILEAGAKLDRESVNSTLGLVCSGCVCRECGVQIPLVDLLCDFGADPNSARLSAIGHGEFDALDALIRRGAKVNLVVAAATGDLAQLSRLMPTSSVEERHFALAFASQYGKVEVVRSLLVSGEDPNRYNPPGAHSHSTPLHQAALGGHLDVVRLLIENGANAGIEDILFHGTALGWARHEGKLEVAEYLENVNSLLPPGH